MTHLLDTLELVVRVDHGAVLAFALKHHSCNAVFSAEHSELSPSEPTYRIFENWGDTL